MSEDCHASNNGYTFSDQLRLRALAFEQAKADARIVLTGVESPAMFNDEDAILLGAMHIADPREQS
jgi:hypothetical protein